MLAGLQHDVVAEFDAAIFSVSVWGLKKDVMNLCELSFLPSDQPEQTSFEYGSQQAYLLPFVSCSL